MIHLHESTAEAIDKELMSIPEKYQKPFNSTHEGLAIILEEFEELKDEIFFGQKRAVKRFHQSDPESSLAIDYHKEMMRKEAVQVAAMCVRFIQELT